MNACEGAEEAEQDKTHKRRGGPPSKKRCPASHDAAAGSSQNGESHHPAVKPRTKKASQCFFRKWTVKDRKLLLAALREHGCEDIELLAKALGDRHVDDVRHMVAKFKERAKTEVTLMMRQQTKENAPIEKWKYLITHSLPYQYRQGDVGTHLIANMFLEAGKKYPDTKNPREINFHRIYTYLSDIVLGNNPPSLSAVDSVVVLQLLKCLKDAIREMPLDYEKAFLQSCKLGKDNSGLSLEGLVQNDKEFRAELMKNVVTLVSKDGAPVEAEGVDDKLNAYVELKVKEGQNHLNPVSVPVDILQRQAQMLKGIFK